MTTVTRCHPGPAGLRSAIATVSLARAGAGHTLPSKIKAAADHGFEGIEVFYECLEHYAISIGGGDTTDTTLLLAAQKTAELCRQLGVEVVCLQPFAFYDGLTSPEARAQALIRLDLWFWLAKALSTDLIQVPTNFAGRAETTGDMTVIKNDMRELARRGLAQDPPIRFAYEAVSWGTHIDVWEDTWEVVKDVDMPNLGLCLDTFHIAGRAWADPAATSGTLPDAEKSLEASLRRMAAEVDVSNIFYIQAGDAERLDQPLTESHPLHVPEQLPRMTWARNFRLFPFEDASKRGYLPVERILRVMVCELGFRGWASMEAFSRELYSRDPEIPTIWADTAAKSWNDMLQILDSDGK